MEFDRLCKEVERRFPEHRKMLEDARLFAITREERPRPNDDHGTLCDWEPDQSLAENLRLPFGCVAIDSGSACVVLKVVDAESRNWFALGHRTIGRETQFFYASIAALPGMFMRDGNRLGHILNCKDLEVFINGEPIVFSMRDIALQGGRFSRYEIGAAEVEMNEREVEGEHTEGLRVKVDGKYIDMKDPAVALANAPRISDLGRDLIWSYDGLQANLCYLELNIAVLYVLVICEPARFIVEESLVDVKEPKGNLIRRSQYRPHYIALKPLDIKKRYLYDEHETESIPRTPHERRGHFRKLTSERYKAKRNEVIWIKPCWIGKTEGVRGKNRYVVRLDL